MKVMIHGAINQSNYGDFLFAALFHNKLIENGIEVEYYSHPRYGISDFFAKNLGYTPDRKHYKDVMNSCDALVYISGGYFLSHKRLSVEFQHTRHFLTPGQFFMRNGKPIYVLGMGMGPFFRGPFEKKARQILQYSSVVTVRDKESYNHCKNLGIDRDIIITADTALVIQDNRYNKMIENKQLDYLPKKKIFLFHIYYNRNVKNQLKTIVAPAIRRFLDAHKDYELVLATDSLMPDSLYKEYANLFESYSPYILKYDNPWALTQMISKSDMILTTKLHMGIVGAAFGVSVVSLPWHSKTQRFYKQIGEENRCIMISDADEEKVLSQLERFEGKHIILPGELIEKGKINLEMLPKQSG